MSEKDLERLKQTRQWAHKKLTDKGSATYRAFVEMESAAFKDGALSKKNKELIAIGISVRIDCESCMQWHIEQAAEAGAAYDEVLEAVEIGIEMGGGPATVSARFALQVMDAVFGA
ncbi:carboxymuconolactone decarboxylase family protein [Solemya velum gill symbiont]|uniref:Alkylhydroperoxidase n=1 Tax=Solemya velum gill symbiont TaxID=2340 RepID=A0A0B0H1M9_SOVGS|nr:carboxymuconolactone decarboxylase family protein [Solemya velum gill symbiont]KHF24123.1 alkylhydroperoxidase AhpD family core domain-containing protein [Solemya velum gill symbiont]OOY36127.1 alkylhydroperoxidase [Solemya velum gill symbiont]OOY38167.1 alkylhydroperoxidase [Solemya velum gill symbiont]OOY39967.1 alkylhydroperoxidase [Solemya velum gill symbiont]OOY47397.1 alkylhydroperoxidase [Solemya velum gill symbiont]